MSSVLKRVREVAEIDRVSRAVKRDISREQLRQMKEMYVDGVEKIKGTDKNGNETVVVLKELFG